jgi:hypothetical protein
MPQRDIDDEIAGQPFDPAAAETCRDDRPTEPAPPSEACWRAVLTYDSDPPPRVP